jgi:hypothetical protein
VKKTDCEVKVKTVLSIALMLLTFGFALPCIGQIQVSQELQGLRSPLVLHLKELQDWDERINSLKRAHPLQDGNAARLDAYLYNAQNDFAKLSLKLTHCYSGSFDPICSQVLALFFPDYRPPHQLAGLQHPYSLALTQTLMGPIKRRFEREHQQIKPYAIKTGDQYWRSRDPHMLGLIAGSFFPWSLQQAHQFRCPKPPSSDDPFWLAQLQVVKREMAHLNPYKMDAILFWAGQQGPQSGDWMALAKHYMNQQDIPLPLYLETEAVLARGLLDATIAAFDAKYTYWVKRPDMQDPQLKTVIPCPNHPSYPSAHSTTGAAAETILSYFFPEDHAYWNYLMQEAGWSRIWAGLHFPIDHEVGLTLGHHVGKITLDIENKQDSQDVEVHNMRQN